MEQIINLVTTNGLAVAIAVYFLIKDYKQGTQMVDSIRACTDVLTEVRTVLSMIQGQHLKAGE